MNYFKISFITILTISFGHAGEIDSLPYYQKFNKSVEFYQQGRYNLALNYFKSILVNKREYRDPAAQLLMAKCQYNLAMFDEAQRSCKSLLSNYPNSPYQMDAFILMGDIYLKQGRPTNAFRYYLNARPLIDDLLYLNIIDQRLYNCIGIGIKEETLEGLLFREKNSFNRSIINLTRGYQAWLNGDNYDLDMMINEIDTFYLPGQFSGIYGALKNILQEPLKRPISIAVVLPLTGYDKEKGQSYLLGLSEYLKTKAKLQFIRFLVYDSAGSSVNMLNILQQVESNGQITAMLGPLTKDEILSLSGSNSSVPILVPKSALPGLADVAENLFFLSPSNKTIAKRTAQMMIKELNFENIAVLSPGDGATKLITDSFLYECHQLGIDPVSVEWYIEKPENVSRQMKNIRRNAWALVPNEEENDPSLNLEIDSLDALFDVDVTDFFELPLEEDIMDRKDSAKIVLETIEALYIPIRPDELTYIGTQLPLYNLNTVLFGNENWLDMTLLNKEVIGPHISGMHVISDVNSAISNGDQDSFSNYFSLAQDHASFIQSISSQNIWKRRQFLDKLRNHSSFYGEHTSIIFFGKNHNENGSAQVLEYSNNRLTNLGIYDGVKLIDSYEKR